MLYPLLISYILLVDVVHDVSRPGQFNLQLAFVLHEEVHQGSSYCGRSVKEEGGNPKDGSLQLLQVEEEVVPVLYGQQVVIVSFQDAGVKRGQVGLPPHIFGVDLRGGKVAAEDKVGLVDFRAAVAARQDAAVPHHSTHAVVPVEDGRGVWEQGLEVVADGEHILVAGVVKVHQLAHTNAVLGEGEVVGNVDEAEDIFPEKQTLQQLKEYCLYFFISRRACDARFFSLPNFGKQPFDRIFVLLNCYFFHHKQYKLVILSPDSTFF